VRPRRDQSELSTDPSARAKVDKTATTPEVIAWESYNKITKDILAASTEDYIKDNLIVSNTADHAATASTIETNTFAQFLTAARAHAIANKTPMQTDAQALLAARVKMRRLDMLTPKGYCNGVTRMLLGVAVNVVKALDQLGGASDGISVIHFDYIHSEVSRAIAAHHRVRVVLGAAINVPGATRNKCLFVLWASRVDTFVHEIGHHLFLPHSRWPVLLEDSSGTGMMRWMIIV